MAERKNLPVSEEPDFSVEMEGILPDDPVHYSQMNNMLTRLLDNELFLKKLAGKLEENKVSSSEKGEAGGIATLGENGKLDQHVDYNNVDGVPAPAWDAVTGKPNTYPPSSHTHSKSEVGLGNVDNTADANKSVNYAASAGNADAVDGYHAAAFAPASHTHNYAATNHSHAYTTITGRPTGLDSGYVRSGQKSGTTIGGWSTAEGSDTTASGTHSHAEGCSTTASGSCSHAEGGYLNGREGCKATGYAAHAEGESTLASGNASHAGGCLTQAGYFQYVIGTCNVYTEGTNVWGVLNEPRFIIGNGTDTARSNAFRVQATGVTYSKGAYNTSGADYAEYFEWEDGNTDGEDRRGLFVSLTGDRIHIAQPGEWILGIVSGKPVVVGNSDPEWCGQFLKDEYGEYLTEERELTEEEIEMIYGAAEEAAAEAMPRKCVSYIVNPDYNEGQAYIPRSDRQEWDAVGMLGVLATRDDGTCQVNGYCTVSDGGIATASDDGYRVIGRVAENLVKVVFR